MTEKYHDESMRKAGSKENKLNRNAKSESTRETKTVMQKSKASQAYTVDGWNRGQYDC